MYIKMFINKNTPYNNTYYEKRKGGTTIPPYHLNPRY